MNPNKISSWIVSVSLFLIGFGALKYYESITTLFDVRTTSDFEIIEVALQENSTKYIINDNMGRQLTYSKFLYHLQSDNSELRQLVTKTLQNSKLSAFFWECPPVSRSSASTMPFEFVVIPADELINRPADITSFKGKISDCEIHKIIAFSNLGGDARLVHIKPPNFIF